MAIAKMRDEVITAAIEGFEAQKERIDAQIAELRQMLTGNSSEASAQPAPGRRRRRMSAAGRRAIAEGQRKRWAAKRGSAPVSQGAAKPKRRLSAAGKRRIIEANKARWARIRAEKAAAGSASKSAAKRGAKKTVGQTAA